MWFVHGMLAVTLVGPEDPAPWASGWLAFLLG